MARPVFTTDTLSFLRRLARHNDREWFRAHRGDYEAHVRAPMVAFLDRLDRDFREFAPELVASPKVSLFRIYRDTRFSADKSPLKTQIGAVFPHRALPRGTGAALYVEIGPARTLIAGGLHAPTAAERNAVRLHLAANHGRWRSIVEAPAFRRVTGGVRGQAQTRMPRGFAADHPAAEHLRLRQWLVWRELPPEAASADGFHQTVRRLFRAAAPFVRFLNEPLVGKPPGRAR